MMELGPERVMSPVLEDWCYFLNLQLMVAASHYWQSSVHRPELEAVFRIDERSNLEVATADCKRRSPYFPDPVVGVVADVVVAVVAEEDGRVSPIPVYNEVSPFHRHLSSFCELHQVRKQHFECFEVLYSAV